MKKTFLIFIIAFIIAKIFIVKASADLNDGLIVYYPFNGNANDISGNGHHGIVNGATLTTDRFGSFDSAYSFDGVDDYIENNTFQDIATNITLTAWIKYESYLPDAHTRTIVAKADNNGENAGFTLHLKETDNGIPRVRFIINDNDGGRSDVISGQITINTWYFTAVSYDGIEQKFFLNGCLVNSKENSGIINSATSNLLIGRSDNAHYGGPVYFHGLIDDIRIYDRVLSENEIQQLYNGPITVIIPEDAAEGIDLLEDQGIVSVFLSPETDLAINLSSDDTSLVTVPETVTIHADQNTATFDITVLDNCINSGSQNVTITASASGYISGSDAIQVADNDVSVEMGLPSGWSVVSLPVIPCNASVSSLFPEAKTLFGYEKGEGYLRVTENEKMEVGKGYWILLDQNQSYTLTGKPILFYKQTLYEAGWEMIGGCTYSAKPSADCCKIGVVYDYVQGAGYQCIPGLDDLEPGKGYWILLRDFTCQALPNDGFPSMDADFVELVSMMNYAVLTSKFEPNLQEKITLINVDLSGFKKVVSQDQNLILTFSEMALQQRYAYTYFANISKIKIAQARIFDPDNPRNQNKLLFFRNDIISQYYDSPYWDVIDSSELGTNWKYPAFEYKEYRLRSSGHTIIMPLMKLKTNQKITLKEGLYFFEELILEENSILNTDGAVQIYVKKLELKKNAKLMGGTSVDPDKACPNNLIILAQRWEGAYYDPEDGIKICPAAKVCGHIFAPSLKVTICKGFMGKETRVYGSILMYQLVTSRCDAGASLGPIWVIYEEYLDCSCELRLETD